MNNVIINQKMKSGKYFIGDICYAFTDHGVWINVLNGTDGCGILNDVNDSSNHLSLYKDKHILGFGTYYGDGTYTDNMSTHQYPVDSGLIGLVPIDVADSSFNEYNPPKGMKFIQFHFDFDCKSDDGVLTFGNIIIDTKGELESYSYEPHEHDNDNDAMIQDEA